MRKCVCISLILLLCLCGCGGVDLHANDTLVAGRVPADTNDGEIWVTHTITWGSGLMQVYMVETVYQTEELATSAYEMIPMSKSPSIDGRIVTYYESVTKYQRDRVWYEDMREQLESEGWTIQEGENITFVGVIQQIHENSVLVSTTDEVGFTEAVVGYHPTLQIGFNLIEGQRVRIIIRPEIRESAPVQVTAVQMQLAGTEKQPD